MNWEYKITTACDPGVDWDETSRATEALLNQLGQEDWELVGVWGYPFYLFLKRPIRQACAEQEYRSEMRRRLESHGWFVSGIPEPSCVVDGE